MSKGLEQVSQLRISFGKALVEDVKKNDVLSVEICRIISQKISAYKTMEFSKLSSLSEENSVEYEIEGKNVVVTFYKKILDSENVLLVVQAAYKTLKFPNYFSLGFVGKIIVDGILASSEGNFSKPEADMLFEFM